MSTAATVMTIIIPAPAAMMMVIVPSTVMIHIPTLTPFTVMAPISPPVPSATATAMIKMMTHISPPAITPCHPRGRRTAQNSQGQPKVLSHAVRLSRGSKNTAFLSSGIDIGPVFHVGSAKIGHQTIARAGSF